MDLEEFLDEGDCTCANCVDEAAATIEAVHDAMMLVHHTGMPIGSTGDAYVETIARQADVHFHEASRIVQDALRMAKPGSAERNSNPQYH